MPLTPLRLFALARNKLHLIRVALPRMVLPQIVSVASQLHVVHILRRPAVCLTTPCCVHAPRTDVIGPIWA